ncbi:hypothetical protein JCM10207_007569 [Rhodosporidiobolus poonsookiae]
MRITLSLAAAFSMLSPVLATVNLRNFTSTPDNSGWGFEDKSQWSVGTYTGDIPDNYNALSKMWYTNEPNATVVWNSGRTGILSINLVGSYQSDQGLYFLTLLANDSAIDTVALSERSTDGDGAMYSLYNVVGLDLYTNYGFGLTSGPSGGASGYLAFQGVLFTAVEVLDGGDDTSINTIIDDTPIWLKPGEGVRTDLDAGPTLPYFGTGGPSTTAPISTSTYTPLAPSSTTTIREEEIPCGGDLTPSALSAPSASAAAAFSASSNTTSRLAEPALAPTGYRRLARACIAPSPPDQGGAASDLPIGWSMLGGWKGFTALVAAGVVAGWV